MLISYTHVHTYKIKAETIIKVVVIEYYFNFCLTKNIILCGYAESVSVCNFLNAFYFCLRVAYITLGIQVYQTNPEVFFSPVTEQVGAERSTGSTRV